jgi:hypothetical protein
MNRASNANRRKGTRCSRNACAMNAIVERARGPRAFQNVSGPQACSSARSTVWSSKILIPAAA